MGEINYSDDLSSSVKDKTTIIFTDKCRVVYHFRPKSGAKMSKM